MGTEWRSATDDERRFYVHVAGELQMQLFLTLWVWPLTVVAVKEAASCRHLLEGSGSGGRGGGRVWQARFHQIQSGWLGGGGFLVDPPLLLPTPPPAIP